MEKKVGRPRIHPDNRLEKIAVVGNSLFTANMITELKNRGKVKINGLGMISIKRMPPHKALNPHTKKYEVFPSYVKLTFNISAETKKRMQLWI